MAIAFDASSDSEHFGTSHSWEHTVGSGPNRLLLVGVAIYQETVRVDSITWGAQELTFLSTKVKGTTVRIELWYLKSPDSGTKDITVVRTGSSRCVFGAASWESVKQTDTFGTVASSASFGSEAACTVVSADGELVVDAMAWQGNGTATVGSKQTERWNRLGTPGAVDMGCAGSSEPGGATKYLSWTLSKAMNWATMGVSLRPAKARVSGAIGRGFMYVEDTELLRELGTYGLRSKTE